MHVCHWCPIILQLEQYFLLLRGVVVVVVVAGLPTHVFLEWPPLPQILQWYGRVSCERFFECGRCVFCGGMA